MSDMHCPQCFVRISPYEHEVNDKAVKDKQINACWNCGLPMEDVLKYGPVKELPPKKVTLTEAEREIADLRAQLEAMKAASRAHLEATVSEVVSEPGASLSYALAQESSTSDLPSSVEAAAVHRGPGRPPKGK